MKACDIYVKKKTKLKKTRKVQRNVCKRCEQVVHTSIYINLSLKEIGLLLEIGFIEEMKTTWGIKKVLQTFFNSS